MLVDGKWCSNWQPNDEHNDNGRFVRAASGFRHFVSIDSTKGFAPEAGRYQLYVAYMCPWASRTLIARRLKKLENVIDVCVLDPRLTDQGWQFSDYPGSDRDGLNGANHMHELYTRADPHYSGRATVPMLWDRQQNTIVNNESADILRILNSGFGALADDSVELYPDALADEIDTFNERLYDNFNNAVYQAGFANSQSAYDEAVARVFDTLDWLQGRLDGRTWLIGEQLTETDIRAFVTLIRFDLAYHGLFKCNLKPLSAYPAVLAYLRHLLAITAFAASVNVDHIKTGYASIRAVNPQGIVPAGPLLDYLDDLG